MFIAVRIAHPFAGHGWMVRNVAAGPAAGEVAAPGVVAQCVAGTFTTNREVAIAAAQTLNGVA